MDNETPEQTPVSVRVLICDGGELEEPQQEDEAESEQETESEEAESEQETESEEAESEQETEESEAEEESQEDESQEDELEESEESEADEESQEEEKAESEEEEESDEREEKIAEEGTRLVHLNLDGLFLDLLGLEVDLDEVTLNLTAAPGEGKLLGNLLSAVGGLFDGGGLGELLSFGDGDGEGEGSSMLGGLLPSLPDLPELNPIERARGLASAIASRIRELVGGIISSLPLEKVLTQFLEELVSQLINGTSGNGEEEAASS